MAGGWGRLGCQSGSYCRNPGGRAGCWNPREQQRRREPVKSQTELPAAIALHRGSQAGSKDQTQGQNTCKASSTMDCTAAPVSCDPLASPEEHLISCRECAGSLHPAPWTLALGTPASGKEVLMLFSKPSCSQPDRKPWASVWPPRRWTFPSSKSPSSWPGSSPEVRHPLKASSTLKGAGSSHLTHTAG